VVRGTKAAALAALGEKAFLAREGAGEEPFRVLGVKAGDSTLSDLMGMLRSRLH